MTCACWTPSPPRRRPPSSAATRPSLSTLSSSSASSQPVRHLPDRKSYNAALSCVCWIYTHRCAFAVPSATTFTWHTWGKWLGTASCETCHVKSLSRWLCQPCKMPCCRCAGYVLIMQTGQEQVAAFVGEHQRRLKVRCSLSLQALRQPWCLWGRVASPSLEQMRKRRSNGRSPSWCIVHVMHFGRIFDAHRWVT